VNSNLGGLLWGVKLIIVLALTNPQLTSPHSHVRNDSWDLYWGFQRRTWNDCKPAAGSQSEMVREYFSLQHLSEAFTSLMYDKWLKNEEKKNCDWSSVNSLASYSDQVIHLPILPFYNNTHISLFPSSCFFLSFMFLLPSFINSFILPVLSFLFYFFFLVSFVTFLLILPPSSSIFLPFLFLYF